MNQRRFEELPVANPEAVIDLGDEHPAIMNQTTMFETTIVHAGRSRDDLLISGANNRKIGRMVTKGAWKGMALYTLTLVERATCPASCYMARSCYGNAMPFSRRNAPGPEFETKIEAEIEHKARLHRKGFVVRLHVLGDFYSAEYVRLWRAMLERHPELHVFGYTAAGDSEEPVFKDVAEAIEDMNEAFPEQCFIRWSSAEPLPGGTTVIGRVPEAANVEEGLVCPAEREATACCATCGLCWEENARDKTIVFVKHGMGSRKSERIAAEATKVDPTGMRRVAPIKNLANLAAPIRNAPPTMLWVKPAELWVDETYQRALSRKSMALLTKIVSAWNWTHYKCPVVVRDEASGRLDLVDGQHTAIAAATHPDIEQIPVMVVTADQVSDRARAFLAHNRDRIAVSALQLYHSSVVAKDSEAMEVERVCAAAGVRILRTQPPSATGYQAGETTALGSIKGLIRKRGAEHAIFVLATLREAGRAPIRADEMKALSTAFEHHSGIPRESIVAMLEKWPYEAGIVAARDFAAASGIRAADALAAVFAKRLTARVKEVA